MLSQDIFGLKKNTWTRKSWRFSIFFPNGHGALGPLERDLGTSPLSQGLDWPLHGGRTDFPEVAANVKCCEAFGKRFGIFVGCEVFLFLWKVWWTLVRMEEHGKCLLQVFFSGQKWTWCLRCSVRKKNGMLRPQVEDTKQRSVPKVRCGNVFFSKFEWGLPSRSATFQLFFFDGGNTCRILTTKSLGMWGSSYGCKDAQLNAVIDAE